MFLVLLDLNRDLPGWFTVLELPNLGSLFLKILVSYSSILVLRGINICGIIIYTVLYGNVYDVKKIYCICTVMYASIHYI